MIYHSVKLTALIAHQSPCIDVALVNCQSLPRTPPATTTEPDKVTDPIILFESSGEITTVLFPAAPEFLKNIVHPKFPVVIFGMPIVKPSVPTL